MVVTWCQSHSDRGLLQQQQHGVMNTGHTICFAFNTYNFIVVIPSEKMLANVNSEAPTASLVLVVQLALLAWQT
jgi:hypothetical protein